MPAAALLEQASALAPRIIALRRAIHAEPELGLETPQTMAKVRAELADLPLEWRVGRECSGAVAVLRGAKPGPGADRAVLLRGDMDALPMAEETGLDFASGHAGRMHACGHDAHTAMLAGAARLLAARAGELAGEVRFMFQPGEEGFHGARFMLAEGLLDPLPQAAFALHVWPNAPHGVLMGRAGAMLASADQLEIVVRGAGGHASLPQDTHDPVPVAAEIVLALQAMLTRRFNAAEATVVTITRIEGGTAHNIIPDTVTMLGTIRTLSHERRAAVREAITQVAGHVAQAHGCTAQVTVTEGFPVTVNDPRAAALGREVAVALGGAEAWEERPHPTMGAEDFSYVLQQVPGAMFFLGVAPAGDGWQARPGLHSPRMAVDETVLPRGAALLAGFALRFLDKGW